MDNVRLYSEIVKLKNFLEDNPCSNEKAIREALIMVKAIWPLLERRGRKHD